MNSDDEKTVRSTIGGKTSGPNYQAETSKHSLTAARFAFFSDKFELLGVIGEGGMGVVYKARQIHLNRLVAIKTLRTAGFSDQALKRFEREAKAASGLIHPNLITIRDYGVDNEGQPYMIFDFIDGITLAELIRRQGQIELDKALDIFIQIAKGLSYAHHRGVLHRDIKPSNIIISADYRELKIVDFGIAKVLDTVEGEQKLTQTGEVFGTPLYMSPEQSTGKALDARSDLYSLGCVIFEALTAIPPLAGESAITTIIKHQNEVPPTLREASLGKEFPAAVERLVAKLLLKAPDQRYQTADELIEDLRSIKEPSRSVATPQSGTTARRPSKRSTLIIAATLLAVTALLLTAATLIRMNNLQKENAPSPSDLSTPSRHQPKPKQPRFGKETTSFDFSGQPITRDLAKQINQFRNLREVIWRNCDLRNNPLKELNMNLAVIDLSGTNFSDQDMRDGSLSLSLEELILDRTSIHDVSMREINAYASLETLSLNQTKVTDACLDTIHLGSGLFRLKTLRLAGDNISDLGLSYLKSLPTLEELDIHACTGSITAKGIESLAECFCLSKLSISESSHIKPVSHLNQLREISIYSDTVTDADLRQLKALPYLRMLKVIGRVKIDVPALKKALPNCQIQALPLASD
jgi:serine/threonine protein kinase